MPAEDAIELTAVLQALADPLRLEIVRELATVDERAAGCSRAGRPVDALAPLQDAAGGRRDADAPRGPRRMVSLRRDELDRRFPGLLAAVLDERAPRPSADASADSGRNAARSVALSR